MHKTYSDTHAWLLLTWDDDNGYIEAVSSPVVRPKSLKTYNILCEDGRYNVKISVCKESNIKYYNMFQCS